MCASAGKDASMRLRDAAVADGAGGIGRGGRDIAPARDTKPPWRSKNVARMFSVPDTSTSSSHAATTASTSTQRVVHAAAASFVTRNSARTAPSGRVASRRATTHMPTPPAAPVIRMTFASGTTGSATRAASVLTAAAARRVATVASPPVGPTAIDDSRPPSRA